MLGLALLLLLLLTAKTSILQRHENAVNLSTYLPTPCVAMISQSPQLGIKVHKETMCFFFLFSLWIDQFSPTGLLTIFMIRYTPHHRGSVRFPFGLGSLQSQYVQASNLRGR